MSETKPRKFKKLESKYIQLLKGELGTNQAVGDLLGVSDATISTAISSGTCSSTLELAAKGVWHDRFIPKSKVEKLAVVYASEKVLETVRTVTIGLGGKFSIIQGA